MCVLLREEKQRAVLIGLIGAAISVWGHNGSADCGLRLFSGSAAAGFAMVALVPAWLMVLIGLPQLMFRITLIAVDSEGVRVRGRLGRMKSIRCDQLRWIQHPTRSASGFRFRSSVEGIEVTDLSNEDWLRLFEIIAKHRVPIRAKDQP